MTYNAFGMMLNLSWSVIHHCRPSDVLFCNCCSCHSTSQYVCHHQSCSLPKISFIDCVAQELLLSTLTYERFSKAPSVPV